MINMVILQYLELGHWYLGLTFTSVELEIKRAEPLANRESSSFCRETQSDSDSNLRKSFTNCQQT